jgi:hypothetical protein
MEEGRKTSNNQWQCAWTFWYFTSVFVACTCASYHQLEVEVVFLHGSCSDWKQLVQFSQIECKLCVCLNLVYWGCSIISNFRNKVPIVKKNPLTVHFSIENISTEQFPKTFSLKRHIGIRNFANTLQLLQINRNY